MDMLIVDLENGVEFWGSGAHLTTKEMSDSIVGLTIGLSMVDYPCLNTPR